MSDNTMKVVSWNTRGFGSAMRRRIVKNFITRQYRHVDIIALQELKATVHAASGSIRVASLHAPNTKEERQTYWEWWDSQIDGEDWILAGDFNNVELSEDSKGKSALMQGSEERAWRKMVNRTDIIDAYMAAVRTKSGLFTRMAFCGQRYDQARLDRFYLSNRGEWCELIKEVIHNTGQILSDHVPISLELQLIRDENCNWRPMSYFKMNQQLMESQEVLMKLKETWEDHPPFCKNSQKRWEMGWGRLRQILKEEKNRQKNDYKEGNNIRREVEDLRIILHDEDNEETRMRLLSKENELRKREIREAKAWRLRSKERWFREGEAPSRYFYSQLKAKFAREKITALETEDGNFISRHSEIMEEVERYYRNLYTRVQETVQIRQAREQVLQLLTSRATQEEDATLHQVPTEEEVEEVVHDLRKEKNPGFDGLVAEVLHACWSFVKNDCIDMIIDFWDRGALTEKNRTAVVKLLPKNSESQWLKNWRPLSLMNLSYKILAKIMANRFKKLMPKLVDDMQTDIIHGRSIANNLLSIRLGEDWAKISDQDCFFLQLDFVKAYDRVEHQFLWQTMHAMGFSGRTIKLVKGLTQGGYAKLHVNEDFTRNIPIQRGVRQGCPLAPYLFTLTTQVLMDSIREGMNRGSITGIRSNQISNWSIDFLLMIRDFVCK
ncbi:hypothetical protein R1sor_024949 [Riccia sorocarpa]|uniref:Reverse transcriptase domain-containing protein n=1 Tax=Riccia sorocarpa TaxID=122646 RepID=A0ABD3G8Q2_9MARC